MSISYATSPYAFVDSQYGTAATSTGIKVNIPVIVDTKYHRKVQAKTFFAQNGWIGPDTFTEGGAERTAAGFPVIRKTDFEGKKGDTIVMGQRTNLATTNNVGKVGGFQIVDAEVGWDTNYKKVKIEQWRQAVRTDSGMNEQRNPFDEGFVATEMDLLSDWSAQVIDTGILAAAHYGSSYHLFRQYGTTNIPPAANANYLVGNNDDIATTRTAADLVGGGQDKPKALSIELGYLFCAQNYFDPIRVGGEDFFGCLMSPQAYQMLLQDDRFRNSLQYARERGIDNPLFKAPGAVLYNNVLIYRHDKVRSVLGGYNPAGLTVSNAGATNSSITEAAYTSIGGGLSSTQITHLLFFGSNAIALAEGRMRMGERTENDYGQIIGRAADNIWGATRMDWLDQTAAAAGNQSSVEMLLALA